MANDRTSTRLRSNAYIIFILLLTIFSLLIMFAMFLPLDDSTIGLLQFYDNLICLIFLVDFAHNLRVAPNKSDYFINEHGWLDLLGSIPSLGVTFKYSGLFRLARLRRLGRIARFLRSKDRKAIVRDVVENRSNYAAFITVLMTIIILATTSVLELQFEAAAPDANIKSGWDAFWYSIVTITTVGYGDHYPVTVFGRITALFIMITGVGIIGALASLLSSVLIGSRPLTAEEVARVLAPSLRVEQEIATIKDELIAMRQLLEKIAGDSEHKS